MKLYALSLMLLCSFAFAGQENLTKIVWEKKPNINVWSSELSEGLKTIVAEVVLDTDTNGNVISVKMLKSSGSNRVDRSIKAGVLASKFKPIYENGVAVPISVILPIHISKFDSDKTDYQCKWEVESEHYIRQQQYKNNVDALKHMDYIYLSRPYKEKLFEEDKPSNAVFGPYQIEFSSMAGQVGNVTIKNNPENILGFLAIQAIKSSSIQPKKKRWQKRERTYTDNIKIYKKCSTEPI